MPRWGPWRRGRWAAHNGRARGRRLAFETRALATATAIALADRRLALQGQHTVPRQLRRVEGRSCMHATLHAYSRHVSLLAAVAAAQCRVPPSPSRRWRPIPSHPVQALPPTRTWLTSVAYKRVLHAAARHGNVGAGRSNEGAGGPRRQRVHNAGPWPAILDPTSPA